MMLFYLIVIVLFIGAMVAYFAGVKKGQPWGIPVLILLVLGLVGVVGYRLIWSPLGSRAPSGYREPTAIQQQERAKRIGEVLKEVLPSGDRIILLGDISPRSPRLAEAKEAWKGGLEEALGRPVTIVGYYSGSSENFRSMQSLEDADAVVAIPADSARPVRPEAIGDLVVVGYFEAMNNGHASVPESVLRQSADEGLLDGAVVEENQTYTPYVF